MKSKYPLVPIGDVCAVGDGAHSKVERTEAGVPYLTSKNIGQGTLKLEKMDFISEISYEKLFPKNSKATRRPQHGDVLIGIIGTFGNAYLYKEKDHFGFSSSIGILRPDADVLIPEFLYYAITSKYFKSNHQNHNAGSVQGYTNIPTIKSLLIPLPPVEVQRKIANTLSSLDEKIATNTQTNQTLESIAQAIFKSWFVDFEPVEAKMAAKERWYAMQPTSESASPVCYANDAALPDLETHTNLAAMCAISGKSEIELAQLQQQNPDQYQQLAETAALFPSAMVDSELGEIPEGWEVSEIGNEVEIVGGGTPSTNEPAFWDDGELHWTTPKDLSNKKSKILLDTERKITNAGLAKISSGLLPIDTVLMSSRAPVGYLALAKIPVAINQGYIAMKCTGDLSPEFIILWAESVMDEILQRASGTTFAEISKKNFRNIKLIRPTTQIAIKFEEKTSPLFTKIAATEMQSTDLANIRDSLLPKLLSGEIDLTNIQSEAAR